MLCHGFTIKGSVQLFKAWATSPVVGLSAQGPSVLLRQEPGNIMSGRWLGWVPVSTVDSVNVSDPQVAVQPVEFHSF